MAAPAEANCSDPQAFEDRCCQPRAGMPQKGGKRQRAEMQCRSLILPACLTIHQSDAIFGRRIMDVPLPHSACCDRSFAGVASPEFAQPVGERFQVLMVDSG